MRIKRGGNIAQRVCDGFKRRLKDVPERLRKTMTHDQGSAMALHHKFSTDLKINSYFGELHRPWQRGCNEVANGLVR